MRLGVFLINILFLTSISASSQSIRLIKPDLVSNLWPPLDSSLYYFQIRIFFGDQLVELYSDDGLSFKGRVISYVYQNKRVKKRQNSTERVENCLYQIVPVNASLATTVARHLYQTGQHYIPTDTILKGWNRNFLDCNYISFQFKKGNVMHQTSYYCPFAQQDSVQHIETLRSNFQYISKNLELDTLRCHFHNALPRGRTYSVPGSSEGFYTLTLEQKASWDESAPVRDYLSSISDTVSNHLKKALTPYALAHDGFCFYSFKVYISNAGASIKIIPAEKARDKEERRQYRKCKKDLLEIFRALDLNFIRRDVVIVRSVWYWNDEVRVVDNTIY